jgi:hypothetical protein
MSVLRGEEEIGGEKKKRLEERREEAMITESGDKEEIAGRVF